MAVKTFTAGSVLTASDTNTYLANSGLVYINTFTLSSNPINMTSIFSSTYQNYRIIGSNILSSTGYQNLNIKLLSGTTASSTTYYYGNTYVSWAGSTGVNNGNNTTGIALGNINTSGASPSSFCLDVMRPNESEKTTFSWSMAGSDASWCGNGLHNTATAYDGLQISRGVDGNVTGTVQVYGYRKA